MKNIIVLGDSTSMTIGLEKKAYPFLLAQQSIWPSDCQFVNPSQPGITAADAAAYFFCQTGEKDISAVIIYLGNCDANATELKKGRFTLLRQWLQQGRESLKIKTSKSLMYNKILRYEWNEQFYNPSLEQPETPEDFKYNLKRVIGSCQKRNIPVILIRPKAHYLFPAGIGKGNFVFYHYFNLTTKFSGHLTHPDQRFLDAYKQYEEGDYAESKKLYKAILENPLKGVSSTEYLLLVTHNYAMACAQLNQFSEADFVFQMLLKEWNSRKDIFLFNYAMLHFKQGRQDQFITYMDQAYDIDTSMYRVKKSYVEKIDEIASEFPQRVQTVSMADIDDDLFVDHCHLLPAGQVMMKERVLDALRKVIPAGQSKAVIKNDLLNLELSLGNTAKFHDYYKTYASVSEEQIESDVMRLKEDYQRNGRFTDESLAFVSSEIVRAIEYYKKHPCFTQVVDICRFPPIFASDIGRFPEYFLVRHIAEYLSHIEKDASYKSPFNSSHEGLLHRSEELFSILPDHLARTQMVLNPIEDEAWVRRILINVEEAIKNHLNQKVQCQERLVTTIFWYFRETLRFGSHSRLSMRYDRLTLEFAAEALTIAGWLDFKNGQRHQSSIQKLADVLIETVSIHERYASVFSLKKDNRVLLTEYGKALNSLLERLSGVLYA
jgi:hypothetical protein